jgi:serine/threonine protein kinase
MFQVALPSSEGDGAQKPVKLDAPVQQRVAEQLIVDLDAGTVDSPFISMDGLFPGTTPGPTPAGAAGTPAAGGSGMPGMGMPLRSSDSSISLDSGGNVIGDPAGARPPSTGATPPVTASEDTSAQLPARIRIPRSVSMPTVETSKEFGESSSSVTVATAGGMGRKSSSMSDMDAGRSSEAASQATAAASKAGQRRFFRVDRSNLYVLVNQGTNDTPTAPEAGSHDTPLLQGQDADCDIPFDQLVMGEMLGTGSQGSVRAVKHGHKEYALKRISISQALSKAQADVERQARKKAIVRELQMLANRENRHPHLIALYNGYFQKDSAEGNLHILMERMGMSTETLQHLIAGIPPVEVRSTAQRVFGSHFGGAQRISNGQTLYSMVDAEITKVRVASLPENVVSMIARDALLGLQHLHRSLRMVHMDIKPANLMLDMPLEQLKVADFGCSQPLPAHEGSTISISNVNLGTKLYMSPERASACFNSDCESHDFNEATDIWSLGISLLELCSGIHPCHVFREDYWDFAEKLDVSQLIFPEQCSTLFNDFICTMLTKCREERPNAAELLKHDFITKYAHCPRRKLAVFTRTVKQLAATYEQKKLKATIVTQLSMATKTKDTAPRHRNVAAWKGFQKGIVGNVPKLDDDTTFPTLS